MGLMSIYSASQPCDLTKLNAAKIRGQVRLLFIGDSNTVGQGSGTGSLATINSRFAGFASLALDSLGYHNQSMWADGNVPVNSITLPQYDSRVVFGAGWASDAGGSIGGNWLNVPSSVVANSGKFKLTPANPFDSFEVFYPVSSYGNNSVRIYVDGTLIDTVNQNQAPGFVKKSYSVARGNHYIEVQGVGSGQVYLNGIIVKDSQNAKGVGIISGHCGGKVSDTITTAPYQALDALTTIAPDFVIYMMTVNDCNSGTALNTYRDNLETFLRTATQTANGVLVVGFPSNSSNTNGALLDQYATKLKELAADYGWGFVDTRELFGSSWTRANSLSMANDANHPNTSGHTQLASYLTTYLQTTGL
jgi:lysophospholipase L1-like esterase